jgi:hypothetical protein
MVGSWLIGGYIVVLRDPMDYTAESLGGPPVERVVARNAELFGTVADRNYLGFWANETLKARAVAEFLDLNKRDVAKVAEVAPASVRYDEKIPKDVLERLQEIANICELVAQHFGGDVRKTALWFKTQNPLFGNISPRDMIRYGRYERLRRFIMEAIAENAAGPRRPDPVHVEAPSTATA